MKLRSFTTVIIRILGMMSIAYGLMNFVFLLATPSSGSNLLLVPILNLLVGIILIAAGRDLARALSAGLED